MRRPTRFYGARLRKRGTEMPGRMLRAIDQENSEDEWPPEGAIVAADFVNGRYWYDGMERTVDYLFEENLDISGTFDPEVSVVPGVGLVDDVNDAAFPCFPDAISAALISTGYRVVVTATLPNAGSYVDIERVDDPDYNEQAFFKFAAANSAVNTPTDGGSVSGSATGDHTGTAQFADGEITAQIDAGAIATFTDADPTVANSVYFQLYNGAIVKTITVYPPE